MAEKSRRWPFVAIAIVAVLLVVLVAALLFSTRPTTVPALRTQTVAEAASALEAAGLVLGTQSQAATSAVGEGRVVEQEPAAMTQARRRSSVDVTVAVAPQVVSVPDLVGDDAESARLALEELLFLPYRVDVFGADGPEGTVAEQIPSSGRDWTTGRPVAYAVLMGPDDGSAAEVPDLKGSSAEAALTEAAEAGFPVQGWVANPDASAQSVVVDQLPEPGLLVRPGTTLLILLDAP